MHPSKPPSSKSWWVFLLSLLFGIMFVVSRYPAGFEIFPTVWLPRAKMELEVGARCLKGAVALED